MFYDDAWPSAADRFEKTLDPGGKLTEMLIRWRKDVDSEPCGELVDVDTAQAAIQSGQHRVPWPVPGRLVRWVRGW